MFQMPLAGFSTKPWIDKIIADLKALGKRFNNANQYAKLTLKETMGKKELLGKKLPQENPPEDAVSKLEGAAPSQETSKTTQLKEATSHWRQFVLVRLRVKLLFWTLLITGTIYVLILLMYAKFFPHKALELWAVVLAIVGFL